MIRSGPHQSCPRASLAPIQFPRRQACLATISIHQPVRAESGYPISNLNYTRPLGVWNPGVFYAAELADLDAKTVKAPNFKDGSTHVPSSPVTVGGAGMSLRLVGQNTVDVAGYIDVDGYISIKPGGYFENTGTSVFWSTVNFNAGGVGFSTPVTFYSGTVATFDAGSTINVNGSMNAAAIVVGTVQIADSLYTGPDSATSLTGTLSVSQAAYLHGDVHLEETTYLEGTLLVSAVGTVQWRTVIGQDNDSSYSVSTADIVYVGRPTFTANRTYYIDEVGAANGKKISFYRQDATTAHTVTLKRSSDGSTICLLGWNAGNYIWVDLMRMLGVWQIVGGQLSA